jgi:MFS family permease
MAYVLMRASQNNYQLIFYMASAVSALSCIAFVLLVPSHPVRREGQAGQQQQGQAGQQQQQQGGFLNGVQHVLAAAKAMPKEFYRMMAVISLYGMGHINESLLEARAIEVGFGKAESTLVVALLSFMVFLCAVPVGKLDDKYGPRVTFALGMASLVLGDLVLLQSGSQPWAVFVACICWGVHWSVLQGPLLSLVVGLSPAKLRGAAFGIFYTVMAFTALAANSMYGQLWHSFGADAAFAASAALISLTLLCLPWLIPSTGKDGKLALAA